MAYDPHTLIRCQAGRLADRCPPRTSAASLGIGDIIAEGSEKYISDLKCNTALLSGSSEFPPLLDSKHVIQLYSSGVSASKNGRVKQVSVNGEGMRGEAVFVKESRSEVLNKITLFGVSHAGLRPVAATCGHVQTLK
jgi:hypothetical protein